MQKIRYFNNKNINNSDFDVFPNHIGEDIFVKSRTIWYLPIVSSESDVSITKGSKDHFLYVAKHQIFVICIFKNFKDF